MAGESILVVEDKAVNRKLARAVLEVEGYVVHTAPDAEEALTMLGGFQPELVLMDLQLPGMDGLELTRRIKADPRFSGMPILALTAYAMNGDREKALAAGCDDYIAKPFDTLALSQRVRELLNGRIS